jgi:hypothetical protein
MDKKSNDVHALINNNLYQVFLMSCYCGLPISFAKHHWFVVNVKGKLSRWEILIQKDCCGESWGHLHKDARDSFEALGTFSIKSSYFFKPELLGYIEGGEESLAQKMAQFIEKSPETYPHCHDYFLSSPNSNTYTQWVLNHFPEFPAKLPWNAFGKGYKVTV